MLYSGFLGVIHLCTLFLMSCLFRVLTILEFKLNVISSTMLIIKALKIHFILKYEHYMLILIRLANLLYYYFPQSY